MNNDEQLQYHAYVCSVCRAARDPRTGRRIALKKLPNVFQSLISCRRVYRELKMLCSFDHDNVSWSLLLTFCLALHLKTVLQPTGPSNTHADFETSRNRGLSVFLSKMCSEGIYCLHVRSGIKTT